MALNTARVREPLEECSSEVRSFARSDKNVQKVFSFHHKPWYEL